MRCLFNFSHGWIFEFYNECLNNKTTLTNLDSSSFLSKNIIRFKPIAQVYKKIVRVHVYMRSR